MGENNRLQKGDLQQNMAKELTRRLFDATGLFFWLGTESQTSADDARQTLEVSLGTEPVELIYNPGNHETGPFTTRLLQALAQEILEGLTSDHEQDAQLESWTWEKLLNTALSEQWDAKAFATRAEASGLTGLSLGFPILVHCSKWSPEVVEVLENLFPLAPICWVSKPDLFLYVPLDRSEGGIVAQKAQKDYGEALIEQIHALLADELGVLATVFVGQVIEEDIWSGFLEVRTLTELHRRFFVDQRGLTAWNVGLASLFIETNFKVGQDYSRTALGNLNKELQTTLKIFLDHDMSIADTARTLYIHRNTLTYRLDRITELTGYNPRKVKGAVHLYLALWLSNPTA